MFSTTINIKLKTVDEAGKEVTTTVPVLLQQASPFKTADIYAENITTNGKIRKSGGFIEDCMGVVIMSPKNLIDQISESENAFEVIGNLANEVQEFINNPRTYVLKQKEAVQAKSEEQSPAVGESTTQPDTNGSEATNA